MAPRRKKKKVEPTKTTVSFRLKNDQLKRLSASASEQQLSRNKLIELLIDNCVKTAGVALPKPKPRQKFTIAGFRLPISDLKELTRLSRKHKVSRAQLVDLIVETHLERRAKGEDDVRQVTLFD